MDQRILEITAQICGIEIEDITPELDLFEAGFLDSFGTLELLVTLSEEFGVELDAAEITREEFSTITAIVATVKKKKGV